MNTRVSVLQIIAAVMVISFAWSISSAGPVYTGSLSSGGGLNGNGDWITGNSTVSWEVKRVGSQWSYKYQINAAARDVSHFILELSDGAAADDFSDISLIDDGGNDVDYEMEFETFTPTGQGNSNPGLPDDIYGIKIGPDDDVKSMQFSFTTIRQPVWSDFYAKGGAVGGPGGGFVHMHNTGFGNPDSDPDMNTFPPADGNVDFHVLAPDSIPEPATLALICTGGIAVLLKRRRAGA